MLGWEGSIFTSKMALWVPVHRQRSVSPSLWEYQTEEGNAVGLLRHLLIPSRHKVQEIRNQMLEGNAKLRGSPASPAAGLQKNKKKKNKKPEMGIRAWDMHISAGLPIPCLFSSEKLPCEEKHSFYYLWGQPFLFIMLMLLCYMPSTSPLFCKAFFFNAEGRIKNRKKNPCPQD